MDGSTDAANATQLLLLLEIQTEGEVGGLEHHLEGGPEVQRVGEMACLEALADIPLLSWKSVQGTIFLTGRLEAILQ